MVFPLHSRIPQSVCTYHSQPKLFLPRQSGFAKAVIKGTRPVLKRHQVLANAIALIGVSAPNCDTVTACSVEVVPKQHGLEVTLRIAQNGGLQPHDQEELQRIVDTAVSEVKSHPQEDLLQKAVRHDVIDGIAKRVILRIKVKGSWLLLLARHMPLHSRSDI